MNTPKKSTLPEYLTRMLEESEALLRKAKALGHFLYSDDFCDLPPPEQHRLVKQHVFMSCYIEVLRDRIQFAFEQLKPLEGKETGTGEA
ncbi:crAss001_48 related protein [Enterovibrio nigricans]|uniref:Uncharacterized protein n=1 Tax=Enterovibrio nigricans DSM 22720 TaxID=1121868 RepID=A0A1T4VZ42_9GAMM|nr:hypothetical protein [Enterovibrio nigricans]SKA70256.1 hypothetical protein SAMN02745132_04561 [Enterovibrio nigricans DSM 22720]